MPLRSPLTAADHETVGILYIRRRLGQYTYGAGRLCTFVTLLVRDKGFPPPLPLLLHGELTDAVTMKSQWFRHAVEAWLSDFLPPDNAMSVDRAAKAAAAADMDAAAAQLGKLRLVVGGRA